MIKTCKDRCQDTNPPPLRLGAGRLCGLLADGLGGVGGGWRVLAFLGAGYARREDPPPGRWSAGDGWGGQCSGGDSAVFNQQLTTFLVVAMVWRLPVFFLCSYCLFWRLLGRFRLPGAGRGLADGLGGLRVGGMGAVGCQNRKGEG